MKEKRIGIIKLIKEHVSNNSKEYIIVTLIFVIGIFLGVLFINNIKENQRTEISSYINNFTDKMKNTKDIKSIELLKVSVKQNLLLALTIWFFGTTVIGIPIVFGITLYRGFCLGYTISACISIMGLSKGLAFVIISLVLQNILFIPALLALSVSGFKLYKSIIKDNRKENIKIEIIRHTIFSLIMLLVLIVSSIIEVFVSVNSLKYLIKYFYYFKVLFII